jgi:predicted acetyltransferase
VRVEARPAASAEAGTIRNLMQLYLDEFSPIDGRPIESDGTYTYPYLDLYWLEQGRYPFLIWADSELAGFALVIERSLIELGQDGFDMAEFFVLRRWRRHGVGELAARQLFDRFPGEWWIVMHELNTPAQSFWRAVVTRYVGDDSVERPWHGPGVDGIELRFRSPTPSNRSSDHRGTVPPIEA